MKHRGFTVIELLGAVVLLLIIAGVFWSQKSNIEASARDDMRKTAINAMYYSLEEVYYPANQSYPKTLSPSELPSVDKELFTDPEGNQIGTSASNYRYEGKNCTNDECKSYSLRTTLEHEADFVKTSRNS